MGDKPPPSVKKEKRYKKDACAGFEGICFQIDLTIMFLLNALRKYSTEDWHLSTENKEGDKFDDIILTLPNGVTLLQAKHKLNEDKKITYDDLLSSNMKRKADFSLPKYFFAYQKVKTKFKVNNVILCTNSNFQNSKQIRNIVKEVELKEENVLYYSGSYKNVNCYTFKEQFIQDLRENIEMFYKENQRLNISQDVISDENIIDFLDHLLLVMNFPSGRSLENIMEGTISQLEYSKHLDCKVCLKHIRIKIEEWYKQTGLVKYFTQSNSRALFCEIRSNAYRDLLKQYEITFDKWNSFLFEDKTKTVCHVIPQEGLLTLIRVYQELSGREILTLDMNLDKDLQLQTIRSFNVDKYTVLIIIFKDEDERLLQQICDRILDILGRYKYKRLLIIGDKNNLLADKIKNTDNDIFAEKTDDVVFSELTDETRKKLKGKRCIVFQGNVVSLNEMVLSDESLDKVLQPDVLVKLAKNERVTVGNILSSDIVDDYYITRRINHIDDSYTDEELYCKTDQDRRVFIITGIAGMGKSVFLTKLSFFIKQRCPHLWVIRIDLNMFKKYLKDCQDEPVDLLKLINSSRDTKLGNSLENGLFFVTDRVVLLIDGVDEVSPRYTDTVCDILTSCKGKSNFKSIFVTTRPHLRERLEKILQVDGYTFQPFSKDDQQEFLAKYWTKSLSLDANLRVRCQIYAEELIKKMSLWIDDGQSTFGTVPLQIRMLAEVFQDKIHSRDRRLFQWIDCKEFLTSKDDVPNLPDRINLAELYAAFIDRKCDILVHDKENINEGDFAEEGSRRLFDEYHQFHSTLALELLLDKNQCVIFNCCRSKAGIDEKVTENLLKIGIVQNVDGNLNFIHRTFAEYFVAKAVMAELKNETQDRRFQKLLLEEFLRAENFYMVRGFLNDLLEKELSNLPRSTFETYRFLKLDRQRTWRGYDDDTFLHVIAGEGCVEIVRFTLICFNYTQFRNPINWILAKLLPRSVHVNVTGDWGDTPLHRASNNGHIRVVKLLVEDPYIDVSLKDGERLTPLDHAAENGHLQVVKYLTEVAKVGIYNKTPHRTAKKGHFDVVSYLIGGDIDVKTLPGCQVLHFSAYHGRVDVVERLLDMGVDVDVADVSGYTVMNYACTAGSVEVMTVLRRRNASPCPHGSGTVCDVKLYFALPRNIPRSEVRISERSDGNVRTVERRFFSNYVNNEM